jgi:hypothetical protein
MSEQDKDTSQRTRRAETVRRVITHRERAPRSPQMARALKRLIWRYTRAEQDREGSIDVQE